MAPGAAPRSFSRSSRVRDKENGMKYLVGCGVAAALAAAVAVSGAAAQEPAAQGVFTAEQAQAGDAGYREHCAGCHSSDLGGNGEAPPLGGSGFMTSWGSQTTTDLFKYAQGMPPGGPRLSDEQYLAIVAYILQQNGASAGTQALTTSTAAPIGKIATGQRPATAPR